MIDNALYNNKNQFNITTNNVNGVHKNIISKCHGDIGVVDEK